MDLGRVSPTNRLLFTISPPFVFDSTGAAWVEEVFIDGLQEQSIGKDMTIKVAINGYGTIGKRVADAVDAVVGVGGVGVVVVAVAVVVGVCGVAAADGVAVGVADGVAVVAAAVVVVGAVAVVVVVVAVDVVVAVVAAGVAVG